MTAVERLHRIVELAVQMNNEAEAAREDWCVCSTDRLQVQNWNGKALPVLLDWFKSQGLEFTVEKDTIDGEPCTRVYSKYQGITVLTFETRELTAEENELIGRYKNHEKV